jgi:two-component system OmpR family response regulator
MKILVVEDDLMIAAAIGQALKDAAYAVNTVHDGKSAMIPLNSEHYDVALLDLGLPYMNGFDVLRHIRVKKMDISVIILTAKDSVEDRIRGLDEGADDYLIKPFEITELLARMRAVTRRSSGSGSPVLSNGQMTLNPLTRELCFEDKTIRLSAKEFSLMQSLLLRPGTILSRQELEDRIYGWNEEVDSNVIEYLIHSIRKKIDNKIITNVRGLGWMVSKEN